MPYRNIFITNESQLSIKNSQLVVDNGELFTFPVEDVRCVLIDNNKTTVTTRLLSSLADFNVCLIVCNEKHLPTATLIPINSFSRQNKRLQLQISQPVTKLKRIWQQIVIAKINNQGLCLKYNGINNDLLKSIAASVQSGDKTNREAYAANVYFKLLFTDDFVRGDDTCINAALNYGYAILRSYIAKTICAYGLEPSFGIHHKNEYNSFNLADDIIEPFRPVVDLFVSTHYDSHTEEFGTAQKAELLKLINATILSDNDKHSVAFAVERMVQSIISSFESDSISIKLPSLLMTSYFNYD